MQTFQDDGLTSLARQTFGGGLVALGKALNPTEQVKPVDVREAESKAKWDWRMVGLIGLGVVLVGWLVMRRR